MDNFHNNSVKRDCYAYCPGYDKVKFEALSRAQKFKFARKWNDVEFMK